MKKVPTTQLADGVVTIEYWWLLSCNVTVTENDGYCHYPKPAAVVQSSFLVWYTGAGRLLVASYTCSIQMMISLCMPKQIKN